MYYKDDLFDTVCSATNDGLVNNQMPCSFIRCIVCFVLSLKTQPVTMMTQQFSLEDADCYPKWPAAEAQMTRYEPLFKSSRAVLGFLGPC